jgi:hypothetical protein
MTRDMYDALIETEIDNVTYFYAGILQQERDIRNDVKNGKWDPLQDTATKLKLGALPKKKFDELQLLICVQKDYERVAECFKVAMLANITCPEIASVVSALGSIKIGIKVSAMMRDFYPGELWRNYNPKTSRENLLQRDRTPDNLLVYPIINIAEFWLNTITSLLIDDYARNMWNTAMAFFTFVENLWNNIGIIVQYIIPFDKIFRAAGGSIDDFRRISPFVGGTVWNSF